MWSAGVLAVQLLAACGGGSGGGSSVPVTIALSATVDTPAQVSLTWSAPPEQTQFDVYRNGVAVSPTHLSGRALTEFTLEPSTRYCYTVNAVQFPLGIVGTSNAACVTTLPTAGWPVSVVDSGGAQGLALALDGNDAAHVGYRSGDSLMHAAQAAGTWMRSTVDATAGAWGGSSIAVDGGGTVHVSYFDAARGALRYATDAGGAWAAVTVATAGGAVNALALDADGRPRIAYSGDPNIAAPLMLATTVSGPWQSEFVAPGPVRRVSIALAGGQTDIGHAAGDGVSCAVLHERLMAGQWTESVVATAATCSAVMAIDSAGVVHLAYMTRSPQFALMHASNAGGGWTVTQVDAFYWIARDEVSIAVDAAGHVHLSYVDHSGLLKHATQRSGAWTRTWVDAHVAGSALQVGRDGRPRIAYAVAATGGLAALRYTVGP
jgi:hypothetical protein